MSTESHAATEPQVKCRQYPHGGARFYVVENGVERLLADTYNASATLVVANALSAEVVQAK